MTATSARGHAPRIDPEAFLAHYFKRIDPALAASFTPAQRAALVRMFGTRWSESHPVNIKRSIGFGRRRFYVVILAGREKRSRDRLRRERATSRLATLAFYAIVAFFVATLAMALLYAVKSSFGVDLIYQGGLHDAFRELGAQLDRLFSGR